MSGQRCSTSGLLSNLNSQISKIKGTINQGSFSTRARNYDATQRFCTFLAQEFKLQKFSNISEKHLVAYVAYRAEKGDSPQYIMSDLSGIRAYHRACGGKNALPENRALNLEKRKMGIVDRAWTADELRSALGTASSMGRGDVYYGLMLSRAFGLRLNEVSALSLRQLKWAMSEGELVIKGKGGFVRPVPVLTTQQTTLLKEVATWAKRQGKKHGDKIFTTYNRPSVRDVKKSLQNWIHNHRGEFQEGGRRKVSQLQADRIRAIKLNGVKLRVDRLSWHGLRHAYAQERYAHLRSKGSTDMQARRVVSEELGHHRTSVLDFYLSER